MLANCWRKPLTPRTLLFWVAAVVGIPYSDWMQAGVTALGEQLTANGSMVLLLTLIGAETTGSDALTGNLMMEAPLSILIVVSNRNGCVRDSGVHEVQVALKVGRNRVLQSTDG